MSKPDAQKRKKGSLKSSEANEEIGRGFYDQILPKLESRKLARPLYMIHEHHATRLHWDLRLEFDGVLESWAIPKEPPTEEGVKRLAVRVEQHPLLYGLWEGTIPEGNYGAGVVKIWDTGTFETLEKTDREISVILKGKRLRGKYVLVRAFFGSSKNNWLFFKAKG